MYVNMHFVHNMKWHTCAVVARSQPAPARGLVFNIAVFCFWQGAVGPEGPTGVPGSRGNAVSA